MYQRTYFVYILANRIRSVLYIGVTSDLEKRLFEHHNRIHHNAFTAKYNVNTLVYYETTTDVYSALEREKQLKRWSRSKKEWLISTMNPYWNNLFDTQIGRSLDYGAEFTQPTAGSC